MTSLLLGIKIASNSLLSVRKVRVIRINLPKKDEKMVRLNEVQVIRGSTEPENFIGNRLEDFKGPKKTI